MDRNVMDLSKATSSNIYDLLPHVHCLILSAFLILCEITTAGFIAMYATLASRDVDCCLIPESPFYLEGEGGLYEFIKKRLKENGHMVIVIAEGAGQDLLAESLQSMNQQDASGNKLLQDVGLWISQKIKVSQILIIMNINMLDTGYSWKSMSVKMTFVFFYCRTILPDYIRWLLI